MSIRIGCQLYTLRDYIKDYENCEETFRYLNSIGIRDVQISAIGPIPADKVAYLLQKYDLSVCVTHISFDRMLDELDTVMAEHKLYNCDTIGIGMMPDRYRESEEAVMKFIKDSSEVAHKLAQNGFKFAYHNHSFEFYRMSDGKTIYDHLIEDTDPGEYTFIPDTYWYQYSGVNPEQTLIRVAGRTKVVHFKDYKVDFQGKPTFAEIGNGNIDFVKLYHTCKDKGIPYIMIEQDSCEIDPRESMAISFRNLCKIASE